MPANKRRTFSARRQVFEQLEALVQEGRLVFPPETFQELKDGNDKLDGPDQPFDFVQRNRKKAVRKASFETVAELGGNELVRRVVDPKAEREEADVYVLALALDLQREGETVGVLTEERKDTAAKLSMTTAAGLLGLVCLPMPAFLAMERIWPMS